MAPSKFPDNFIDNMIDLMLRAVPDGIIRHLQTLGNNAAGKIDRSIARQSAQHYIGNMVVLAFAGLERVISDERRPAYEKVMLAFDDCIPMLTKYSFTIPPQITEAIQCIRHPNLCD